MPVTEKIIELVKMKVSIQESSILTSDKQLAKQG